MVAGIIEALFNPLTGLVIVIAFVCCDVVNAKDFQEQFHIAKFNDAFGPDQA
jgi:hypothetical protein